MRNVQCKNQSQFQGQRGWSKYIHTYIHKPKWLLNDPLKYNYKYKLHDLKEILNFNT